jgi:hypothetical protein
MSATILAAALAATMHTAPLVRQYASLAPDGKTTVQTCVYRYGQTEIYLRAAKCPSVVVIQEAQA